MAFIRLNENNMILDVVIGAKEEYKPTEEIEKLYHKVEDLRNKMSDWKKKEEIFLLTEINPIIKDLREKIVEMNEQTYPELKASRLEREHKG